MNVIEIKNLTKSFDGGKSTVAVGAKALDNLNLSIEKGEIIGLIGADGSGKTTLLRLIVGLLRADEGEISVLGFDPKTQKDQIHSSLGYMPQKFGLYEDLSVIENLRLWADLKDVTLAPQSASLSGAEHNFDKMLEFTNLAKFQDRLAGRLSGGMKQKLGLACALLGNPKLLVLDEPSVGVDPISRRELMKMVKALAADGDRNNGGGKTTIIWSTAYLDEAFNFDRAVVLSKGKVIYQGKPHDLSATTTEFEEKIIEFMGGYRQEKSQIADTLEFHNNAPEYTIEARGLFKKYGDFYAVKNNSFKIKKGEIFGFLGPNGAGKTTSFKMLCGLSSPTKGTAEIMGVDVVQNPSRARSFIGYMAQKFSLYAKLSVLQNLEFFAGVYGLKGPKKREKINRMIAIFNLEEYLNQNSEELPLGYKQRLSLACAIVHEPAILFLDEPTSGVDPVTRQWFWSHIRALAAKGVTIMITTHFMDEAEYCDKISLFYDGETIAMGTPEELKASAGAKTMEEAFAALIERGGE